MPMNPIIAVVTRLSDAKHVAGEWVSLVNQDVARADVVIKQFTRDCQVELTVKSGFTLNNKEYSELGAVLDDVEDMGKAFFF